ncbi:protein CDV3 homolog [Cylas formicarius]|uniref:protein CDV3 homolog n=1 Tax=Cylas formicarius TaxID=197179 RepID=UPI002958A279|nr:protein CDV3 homolog [Cylas formicarius]
MADLDDFFAKKDRKKSKTSKKFATTDEVAKKLEDTVKKSEKQKKERVAENDENSLEVHEQDEWKDFEEEKKDYSGLKIGNLSLGIAQESSSNVTEIGTGEQQEGTEQNQEPDRKAGPWKRIEPQEEVPRPVPLPEKKIEGPPQKSGAYVAPSLRNAGSQQASSQLVPIRLRGIKGAAPDIHNEEFFPTLSKSGDGKKNRNEGSFETVQHNRASSYRQQLEQSKGGPKLNLGNRFNTLSNDS